MRGPGPMEELEMADIGVELAAIDENKTMFDADTHPKEHRASDEGEPVCDDHGNLCDLMHDTPPAENGIVSVDPAGEMDDLVEDGIGSGPGLNLNL